MNALHQEVEEQAAQWLAASGISGDAISELSEYTQLITRFFRGGDWLFRGDGELYEFPATPSLLRGEPSFSRRRYPDRSITDQEIEAVEDCQQNHPDGSDRYIRAFIPSIHRLDVNWLPLARHFGFGTRLLDVSANPLVALFFACEDVENTNDGYVYVFASGNFRPVNDRNPAQKSISDFPPIPINYLDLYDVDAEFEDRFNQLPYLFDPSIPQERLQAQAGKFLFWRDLYMNLFDRTQAIPLRIRGAAKPDTLSELSAFGITKQLLFPNEAPATT
jgi:hypothetical protein